MERLIRLKEVLRQTGLGRTSLYEKIKAGHFPRQVKLGPRLRLGRNRPSKTGFQIGSSAGRPALALSKSSQIEAAVFAIA